MGRVKELMMEMEEHNYYGFSEGEKYVCTNHFEDKYLNQYIQKKGDSGICSYCHRKGCVIDMSKLAEHIGMTISVYFNDVDSESLPLASSYYDDKSEEIPDIKRFDCFAVPEKTDVYEDTSELMDALGLHTECKDLNTDIDHIFEDNTWIKKDPFNPWWNEEKEWKWKHFSEKVKHSYRYTFWSALYDVDILTDLNNCICKCKDIFKTLPIGTLIYRTRSLNFLLDDNFGFKDITSAPDEYAGQCRMSPAGVSMFYGAFDKKTAIEESIKSKDEKYLVVGEFSTLRDLNVVNLMKLPDSLSIWMDNWQAYAFLKAFHKDITKPLHTGAKEEIEYVPSQIFTEYLRWIFRDKSGKNIDGLIYQSCKTKKANIVLFCDNEISKEWIELVKRYPENRCDK